MNFAKLMCVGLLAVSQNIGASLKPQEPVTTELSDLVRQRTVMLLDTGELERTNSAVSQFKLAHYWWTGGGIKSENELETLDAEDISPSDDLGLTVAQHLWDEEWSTPAQIEEIPLEEALMMDSPEVDDSELVAQHLWDEEWSVPGQIEEVPLKEALMMDSPEVDDSELVAQHLWDEEWLVPVEIEEVSLDEALMMDSPQLNESELVAQYLWDEEWSVPVQLEEAPLDEALMMDSPKSDESELLAHFWWNKGDNVSDEQELEQFGVIAQHLWDEEWAAPAVIEKITLDEALMMDAPELDETEMVAGYLWNIAHPEFADESRTA